MEGEKSPDENKKSLVISEYWKKRLSSKTFLGLLIVLLILLWFYVGANKNKNTGPAPIPIVSGVATTQDIPIYLSALGTVTPIYTVIVQTQINGILMKVLFKEGQLVKKGQLLAQIDQRPYDALLIQYEGDLKRDSALLANARVDLKRYQTLWKQDSISQQTLATQQSLVEQYEGDVKTDLGLIQSTKVSLIYCKITSPIDGRVGLRLIDPGNFVQITDTTGIAVLTTAAPMTVIFPIAEDYIQQVLPQAYTMKNLLVKAYDRQQEHLLATGKLLALDNQISTVTGTVRLRAVFDNKNNKLFPNQFVNIKILVNTLHEATVVSTAAVQHTTTEDFVYIVNANKTVTVQPVVLGPVSGDFTVIKKGLLPGQAVVINGADKLINGSKIIVQAAYSTTAPVKKVGKTSISPRIT